MIQRNIRTVTLSLTVPTIAKSDIAWKRRQENILKHIDKASILGFDLRHFTTEVRIKIIGFVLSLPPDKQAKIVFLKGA